MSEKITKMADEVLRMTEEITKMIEYYIACTRIT
jgi:hypothetical protein